MLTKNDVFTLAKNFPLSTFLFVGDKDQLPPIGDEDFSIFDVFECFTLAENHRCGTGNNIFDLIEAVRVRGASVDYRDYVDGKNVVKIDEIDGFVNEEVPIIVYYNKTRQKWNHYVLGLRTGGKITTETKFISNESNKMLKNGQIFYPDHVTVKNWNLTKGVPLKYYELGIETRKGMKTVNYLDPENREILNMFLQPLVESKNWIKYFALKERYPDVDLGYCITSHKAQGSTFDTAIIDWSDIATSPQQTRKASLYVACSRVSNKLLII
jgi:exodeoxyribonuclease-5